MKDSIIKVCIVTAIMFTCLVIGYLEGKASIKPEPAQTITKTEIQYVDRVVEKVVYVKDTSKTDTTVTKPDGTVEHTVVQNNIDTTSQAKEDIKISTQTTEKTEIKPVPSSGFIWFPMNVNGGVGLTEKHDVLVMGDTTLAGWGISKADMSFKFASIGTDYNKDLGWGLHLTAVSYRFIPAVLTNTYIGTGGYVRQNAEKGLFINLSVGL